MPERIGPDAEMVVPLDQEALLRRARDAVERQGATSLAIVILHAYRNRAHERRAREQIERAFPDVPFALGHRRSAR